MEPIDVATAFTATLIAIGVCMWGLRLHNEELRTGLEPKGYNWFLLIVLGSGFFIYWLGTDGGFFGRLTMTLTGVFSAIFAVRCVWVLVRGKPPGQPEVSPPTTKH